MWRSKARLLLALRACSKPAQVPPIALRLTYSPFLTSCSKWRWSSNLGLLEPRFFSHAPGSSAPNDDFGDDPFRVSAESDAFLTGSDVVGDGDENGDVKVATLDEVEVESVEVDLEQVENVVSILQSSLDRPLEASLDDLVFDLSEGFVMRVLETPLVLGENLLGFFRWALRQPDFAVTARVVDCLVNVIGVHCRKKEVYGLWDLIKEIGEKEKGLVSRKVLNDLISMVGRLGKGKAALEMYNKFDEFGCERDADTYYLTIEALCARFMFDDAASISEKLLDAGKLPSDEKIGKLVVSLCKGDKAKVAHLVFLMAKENEKCIPKSSLNFLIGKLCREDETVCVALGMLEDFTGESRRRAIKPFSAVLHALCRMEDMEEAKKLLSKMVEQGPPPGNAAFNLVISRLSKAGDLGEAIRLKKVMESRGLRPDVYTYSVIMSGYAKGGQMEDASRVFAEAKKVHSKLGPVPYHILIRGHCKLEDFDKALECFREMKENGVSPNHDEYNKLIQSLCLKALDWRTSEVLLEEMKEYGLQLNGITRGLIRAVKELEVEAQSAEAIVEA